MGWHADSNFKQIAKGTVLTLSFAPHVVGYEAPVLKAGDLISVAFADNSRTQVTAVEASDTSVTIETKEGALWMMTPLMPGEHPFPSVDTGQIPSEDWIIRASASR